MGSKIESYLRVQNLYLLVPTREAEYYTADPNVLLHELKSNPSSNNFIKVQKNVHISNTKLKTAIFPV